VVGAVVAATVGGGSWRVVVGRVEAVGRVVLDVVVVRAGSVARVVDAEVTVVRTGRDAA
jgi:hypothetical protein